LKEKRAAFAGALLQKSLARREKVAGKRPVFPLVTPVNMVAF
jgi:hypothetical protein